jgi:phosphoribosylamine--glycine ligase
MNILVIGSGGREHALCYALKKSPQCKQLYCAPGNTGIAKIAERVKIKPGDFDEIVEFCRQKHINFVVVGPEAPLVAGIADFLEARGIMVFGPVAAAARLEASKTFTKEICRRAGIPTARAKSFKDAAEAKEYVREQGAPIVIKADGLAAGKGVVVAKTVEEALAAIDEMLVEKKFGAAGAEILVEECLKGRELSFFVVTNGDKVSRFGTACDYKRAGDGNTGPNTGGMGTYSPGDMISNDWREQIMDNIIHPTLDTLREDGIIYKGFLFAGLMITEEGPKLIEFNCRMGDPETQSILPRLENDIVNVMLGHEDAKFSEQTAVTVVYAAKGYPDTYQKDTVIKGVENISGALVFHAGTARKEKKLVNTGGRVLGITALANGLEEARKIAYDALGQIDWPEGFYRKDIGIIYKD